MSTKIKTQDGWKNVSGFVRSTKQVVSIPVSVSSTPGYASYNIVWPKAFPDDKYVVDCKIADAPYWASVTHTILKKDEKGLLIGLGLLAQAGVTFNTTLTVTAIWVE